MSPAFSRRPCDSIQLQFPLLWWIERRRRPITLTTESFSACMNTIKANERKCERRYRQILTLVWSPAFATFATFDECIPHFNLMSILKMKEIFLYGYAGTRYGIDTLYNITILITIYHNLIASPDCTSFMQDMEKNEFHFLFFIPIPRLTSRCH